MENQLSQFKQKFIEDTVKLLDELESNLLLLETDFDQPEIIQSIFRTMHTLKGISSMFGFENISNITHRLESIYVLIRDNKLKLSPNLIQLTFVSSDYIRNLLHTNDLGNDSAKIIFQKISESIDLITGNTGLNLEQPAKQQIIRNKITGAATWQIIFYPDETILSRNINIINTWADLFKLGEYRIIQDEANNQTNSFSVYLFTHSSIEDIEDALIFILDYCKIVKIADFNIFDPDELEKNKKEVEIAKALIQNIEKDTSENTVVKDINKIQIDTSELRTGEYTKNRINVDATKLDELMYLVSELITTNSQLVLASKNHAYNPLRPIFEKIDKLSKLFRNNTLNLRLVPINEMILKFQRLVRDLSQQLHKEVELITQGTDTELDKNTIDALADPLMHLIRNCLDHGIETPEVRLNKNKPAKGVIKITAFHSGNFVFIQVQDDGQGIDTDKIRKKAIEKNLISPDSHLTEKEAFDLIFLPGFSTAESLTHVSGRGVGMDVVKKKLTELRGQIEITSEKNLGTSFTIKLHQTLAILDTMLFQADDMFFMVPLSDIEVCSIIAISELDQRKYTSTIKYGDKLIPYIDIYNLFNLNRPNNTKLKLLIINRQEQNFAIAADAIIGEHQAVLKTLGDVAKKQPYIAVASILGNGNLAFLLDMNSIQNLISTRK